MNPSEYTSRVTRLFSRYLQQHDTDVIPELQELFSTVHDQASKEPTMHGALAFNCHALALYYINDSYAPSKAQTYAIFSEHYYKSFMSNPGYTDMLEQITAFYEEAVLIHAYCCYQNDDFHETRELLYPLPASTLSLALMGTAMLRIGVEENSAFLLPAYNALKIMDEHFDHPLRSTFEEDIIRTAYNFYYMFYTHQLCPPDYPERIPFDPDFALQMLKRVYALLTDEEQKAWLMEDIASLEN